MNKYLVGLVAHTTRDGNLNFCGNEFPLGPEKLFFSQVSSWFPLTQLFQSWYPIFLIMFIRNRGASVLDSVARHRIKGHGWGWHSRQDGLETPVGQRRLIVVCLQNPAKFETHDAGLWQPHTISAGFRL